MTLIPGDGIGPEISASVQQIFEAAKVSIKNKVMHSDVEATFITLLYWKFNLITTITFQIKINTLW